MLLQVQSGPKLSNVDSLNSNKQKSGGSQMGSKLQQLAIATTKKVFSSVV